MNFNFRETKLYRTTRYLLKYRLRKSEVARAKEFFDKNTLKFLEWEETVNQIIEKKLSIARFCDGEFSCLSGFMSLKSSANNYCSDSIRIRLTNVFNGENQKLLIGIIPPPHQPYGSLMDNKRFHWNVYNYYKHYKGMANIIDLDRTYADCRTFIKNYDLSMTFNDEHYFYEKISAIWKNRDVVFVTSLDGRLDRSNKIFDLVSSKALIETPKENAYHSYEKILNNCMSQTKDKLFLLSIGFTACILADDLSKNGYQAIDIGSITSDWRIPNK